MQVLLAFMLGVFVLSGTRVGTWFDRRPILLLTLSVLTAGTYYSYRTLS